MKIALLGYGRMGKAVEKIAIERGHAIVAKIDKIFEEGTLKEADVAINFSVPDAAVANIRKAFDFHIPVICGTTGWLEHYEEIIDYCHKKKAAFLYASNFSIGVNLFFKMNEWLAKLMASHKMYTPSIEEIHHKQKLDSPSGTAISLAEGVIENSDYDAWKLNKKEVGVIPIVSKREGEIPGTHTVLYAAADDTISITHQAHNRQGFALGAVMAAEWLQGKQGVFSMKEVLNLLEFN